MRTYPRQQNREFEGLGDIVIRAGFEAEYRICIAILSRQHDDRCTHALLAHLLAGFAAIHVRHIDIEQDQVDSLG